MESVWMINPNAASAYYPLLKGALSGLEFTQESEPEESIPYVINSSGIARPIESLWDIEDPNEKYVFVSVIRGVVLKHDAMCGPRGMRTLAQRMLKADKNRQVVGHLLVTESGGGMAAAVPEMADAIKSLSKPVVAWVDGMSASAAYYINSYCQHIMASRATDEIGCIGVMIQFQGLPKYAKLEDGSVAVRIYADGSEEKNLEYEQALEGNFTLIKERMLNPHCEQFKADVRSNRSNVTDDQMKGLTYKAADVIGSLIDSIGSFDDAVAKVIELAEASTSTDTNNSKPLNNKTMNELKNLNAIASVKDFEVLDGHASFNEDQLTEIDAQIGLGQQAIEQTTQLQGEVATLKETVSAHEATISAKDARIQELESSLAAFTGAGEAADESSTATVDTDAGRKPEKVDSLSESMAYCENHLKNSK